MAVGHVLEARARSGRPCHAATRTTRSSSSAFATGRVAMDFPKQLIEEEFSTPSTRSASPSTQRSPAAATHRHDPPIRSIEPLSDLIPISSERRRETRPLLADVVHDPVQLTERGLGG